MRPTLNVFDCLCFVDRNSSTYSLQPLWNGKEWDPFANIRLFQNWAGWRLNEQGYHGVSSFREEREWIRVAHPGCWSTPTIPGCICPVIFLPHDGDESLGFWWSPTASHLGVQAQNKTRDFNTIQVHPSYFKSGMFTAVIPLGFARCFASPMFADVAQFWTAIAPRPGPVIGAMSSPTSNPYHGGYHGPLGGIASKKYDIDWFTKLWHSWFLLTATPASPQMDEGMWWNELEWTVLMKWGQRMIPDELIHKWHSYEVSKNFQQGTQPN